MEEVEIIDYAMPTMKAERALKDLHNAFLDKDGVLARQKALEAAFWSLMAWEALGEPEGVEGA